MLHEPLYKACLLALAFDLTAQVDLELQAGPSMHPGKLMLKAGVHAKILSDVHNSHAFWSRMRMLPLQ